MTTPPLPSDKRGQAALEALALAALFAVHFSPVRATNFAGFDEWIILWLTSHGLTGFPYSNRPLNLLFTLPGAFLPRGSFLGFTAVHLVYLVLGGLCVRALARCLVPGDAFFAFGAAAIVLTWAPMDFLRLTTMQMAYSGITLAMSLAFLLALWSWSRRSPGLLVASALVGLVAARSYEGVLPVLAAVPVAFWLMAPRDRMFWRWSAVPLATVAVGGVLAVWPLLRASRAAAYQSELMKLDLDAGRVVARIARQFGFHLLPLVSTPFGELREYAVAGAVALCAVGFVLVARAHVSTDPGLRPLVSTALLGLLLAGLGYVGVSLSASVSTPTRAQFLAGPGIALFLAGMLRLLTRGLPERAGTVAFAALVAGVVAVGTARTASLQRGWDAMGLYPRQHRVLSALTALAPDLAPNTLVVLVDQGGAFRMTFTFRHAVDYLYQGRALGLVAGGDPFLYDSDVTPRGLHVSPWEVVRGPWGVRETWHRSDEIVLLRHGPAGEVEILDSWPPGLPAVPGQGYAPRARIRPLPQPAPWERRVLELQPARDASVVVQR
ncbi:MAG TPA: hypothetical protein VFQ51_17530 [Vicinamibacteria bacterium]|nr:hypothetical protein [Vicinamibacteria bacterium]